MRKKYTEENIDELLEKIDAYIEECEDPDTNTVPGFAIAAYKLGFSSRTSLWDYAQDDNESISEPIKRLMLYIEADYEGQLRKQSCTGAIFALKNRGWTDKQEIEHSGGIVYLPAQAKEKGL